MRFVRSLFAILAAVFVTAVAWEAQAQQIDPYVSCVRCHALPMQQAQAQMQQHGSGYSPNPEQACAYCHDTWIHEQDPSLPPYQPYFWPYPLTEPVSLMTNLCLSCHSVPAGNHPSDVFPYFDTTPLPVPPTPPTSVLPLFEAYGWPNQDPYLGGIVCSTCHDPHDPSYLVNGRPAFLRIGSSFEQTAPLCGFCHTESTPMTTGADLVIADTSDSVRFQLLPAGDIQIDVTVKNRGNASSSYGNCEVFWESTTGYRTPIGSVTIPSLPPDAETVIPIWWMPPPGWTVGEGFFVFQLPPRPLLESFYPVEFVRSMNVTPAPTNLRVTYETPGEIHLAWDPPPPSFPGSFGWEVYRDGVKIPTPVLYQPSYIDSGLAPETPHVYTVVAVSPSGGLPSQPSDPVGGTTGTGAVLRVPEDYPTIQAAIDAAWYGTSIHVAPGTYSEPLNFANKFMITVKGQDANGCVLDYRGSGAVGPTIDLGLTTGYPGNTLAGFTIRNGWVQMNAGDVLAGCVIVADTSYNLPLATGGGLVAQCVFDTPMGVAFQVDPNQFLTSVNSIYFTSQPFLGYPSPAGVALLLNNDFPYWYEYEYEGSGYEGSGNFSEYPLFAWPGPPQEYLPDPGSPTAGRGLPLEMYDPAPNVGAFQPWRPYTPQPPSELAATIVPEAPARVRLTWTASIDDPARMFEYFIYRSESPTFPPSTPSNWYGMVSASQFSFEDQNIIPGTTYYYQVRGYAGPGLDPGTELLSAPTNTASITCVNSPPNAVGDAATTPEDQPATVTVLANDTDLEGDFFHILDVGYPQHGSAVMNADQTIEYTPDPNFFGTDSFSYTVIDVQGGIASALVTVDVLPVNDPPVAVDDAYTTNEETALSVPSPGVLANDWDVENDPLSAILETRPAHGNLVEGSQGSFTYHPQANFSGQDSYTYKAWDYPGAISNLVTVTITVNPVNDRPVIQLGQNQTVNEDAGPQTVTGWATGIDDGDPEIGQQLTLIATSINGALFSAPPAISLTDGTLTYTPAANANGVATVTVKLTDDATAGGTALTATGTFTITIAPVNDPPVFLMGSDQAMNEDAGPQTSASWATGIYDGDDGVVQALTFSATNDNNALFTAQPAIAADGTLSYTAATNANGVATVIVTLTDDATAGGPAITTAAQSFTITVTPVNDPPQANDDTAATASYVPVLIAVLGNDTDVDGDTRSVSSTTPGANGSTEVQAGGSILYTPDPGFAGTDTFSYTVDDGNGGTDTATVTVSVRPQKLRITALTMATVTSGRYTNATATPLAVDEAGAPLAGVSVDGRWSGLTSDVDTGLTGVDGKVTVSSNQVRNANGTFTFTIDTAVKAGFELYGPPASVLTNSVQYPAPPPPGGEMHVASIVMGLKAGKNTSASATVAVVDANGVPVASAAVSGSWSGAVSGTTTETTGADGKVTLSSAAIKNAAGKTFSFAVTGISKNGWTYDSNANVETGNSITAP